MEAAVAASSAAIGSAAARCRGGGGRGRLPLLLAGARAAPRAASRRRAVRGCTGISSTGGGAAASSSPFGERGDLSFPAEELRRLRGRRRRRRRRQRRLSPSSSSSRCRREFCSSSSPPLPRRSIAAVEGGGTAASPSEAYGADAAAVTAALPEDGRREEGRFDELLVERLCLEGRPEEAHRLLDLAWASDPNGTAFARPTRRLYGEVAKAYARRAASKADSATDEGEYHGARGTLRRVEALARDLHGRYRASSSSSSNSNGEGRDMSLKPTEALYVSWLVLASRPWTGRRRWRRRQEAAKAETEALADAALRTEAILQELVDCADGDRFWPSTAAYNVVICAWAKCGSSYAASRAEAWLRRMCKDHLSKSNPEWCPPDARSFAMTISAWASAAESESSADPASGARAGHRAEAILGLLEEAYERSGGDPALRPNAHVWTAALSCWAKSRHVRAPDRCEKLLRAMLRQCDEYDGEVEEGSNSNRDDGDGRTAAAATTPPPFRPDTSIFNACMSAWSRSNRPEAPERVEELYRRMLDRGLEPDEVTYAIRMNVWERKSKSRRIRGDREAVEAAAEKSHEAFLEMLGDSRVKKPDALRINRAMLPWAKLGRVDRVDELLELMTQYGADDAAAAPNRFTWNFVLLALSRSDRPDAAERAQLILLKEMPARNCEPDLVTFNTLLACYAKRANPGNVFEDRALELANRMSTEFGIEPDVFTYGTLFKILLRCGDSRYYEPAEVARWADELLREMKARGVAPNAVVRRLARRCQGGSNHKIV